MADKHRLRVAEDQCSAQLNDLCGKLLMYHAVNGRLPHTLDELPGMKDKGAAALVCPVSGLKYVYDPVGLNVEKWPGSVVVYDASPCHWKSRWCIMANGIEQGATLSARVLLIPEELLQSALKKP